MPQILQKGKKSVDGLIGGLRYEQDNNRIIGRDNDNLPRLLILADGIDFVMKVSKPGFDVLTATDDQLLFDSSRNLLKIVKTLNIPLSVQPPDAGAHQYSVSVPHGLTYTPSFEAYADVVTGGVGFRTLVPSQEYSPAAYSTLIPSIVKEIFVDSTNVIIQVSTLGITIPLSYDFTVYLKQETAN